uniref:NADH-ubiquinone oxidoreductase chain 2 n=1 Tax=Culicoides cylindratus TaxID=469760 RepID=A8B0U9_9DIPT|nr:NADH dehydrogenase subunit 2 [Culicoides cylindratus]
MNPSKLIFLFTLFSGTLITMSSSSWIGMWIGLELNLLSFIPLMNNNFNLTSTEAAIQYFLVQAFASLIFLFASIVSIMKFSFFNYFFFNYENLIINFSMLIKLGSAPFQFWFPNIVEGLTWMNTMILFTWQKLGPLSILSYSYLSSLIIMVILMSSFIGAIGGFNQTSLRKLLAFSSINHISWLLAAELYSNSLWLMYFLIYSFINFSIIILFKNFNFFHLNQIFMNKNNRPIMKFCFFLNILSLGGLPPFLGFLPKWLIIENMMKLEMFFLMFFMIMMTLITLFFYTRLTFSAILLYYPSLKWKTLSWQINKLTPMIIMNLMNIFFMVFFLWNNFF